MEKVSQTVFDELVSLASCEDACFTLLGYLDNTDTPKDCPSYRVLKSLHVSISIRMAFLVDHYKYEKLPF